MWTPRLAAFFLGYMAKQTGLPWPDSVSIAESELLDMSDAEIAREIDEFNESSEVGKIVASKEFIDRLRSSVRKSTAKRDVAAAR